MARPKCILSNNGTQFASKLWKNKFVDMKIEVMFSPIRHPQANPSKICMREFGKFFHTYCCEAHSRWPEMLSDIEGWLNKTMSDSTGYSPVELIFNNPRPDVFEEFLKKGSEQKPLAESLQEKFLKTYVRMKEKTAKRNKRGKNRSSKCKPQVDLVVAKCQAISDAVDGITKKFFRPYDGPWKVTRVINPTTREVANERGKIMNFFNQKAIKPYLPSTELKKTRLSSNGEKDARSDTLLVYNIRSVFLQNCCFFYNIRVCSKIELTNRNT